MPDHRLDAERMPPVSYEAEDGVVGSILLNADAIHEVSDLIGPDDFFQDQNALIFRIMLDAAARGRPLDVITLNDELIRTGRFDEVGGNDTLVRIMSAVPHAGHAAYYATIVREKAISRRLIDVGNEILKDVYSNQHHAEELLERAYSGVIGVERNYGRNDLIDVDAAIGLCQDRIDAFRDGRETYLSTGYRKLDEMIGGFQDGHMIVLASRPSIGKSAMLLDFTKIFGEQARGSGKAIYYVSLEMPARELAGRMISAQSQINGRRINVSPNALTDDDLAAMANAREYLRALPIKVDQAGYRTVAQVASRARRLKHRGGLAAIVIDYLQLLTPDSKFARSNRQEQVASMSRDIKHLALNLEVPIIVACQVNRASEQPAVRGKPREKKVEAPRMVDIRESGAIEQDADQVLILHRPDFHDPTDRPGEADLIVGKNRGGRRGVINLWYDKKFTRFRDYDPDKPPGIFDPKPIDVSVF